MSERPDGQEEATAQQQAMDELSRRTAEVTQQYADSRSAALEAGYVQALHEGPDDEFPQHPLDSDHTRTLVGELDKSRESSGLEASRNAIEAVQEKLGNSYLRTDERAAFEQELKDLEAQAEHAQAEQQAKVDEFRDNLSEHAFDRAVDEVNDHLTNTDEFWGVNNEGIRAWRESAKLAAKTIDGDDKNKPVPPKPNKPSDNSDEPNPDRPQKPKPPKPDKADGTAVNSEPKSNIERHREKVEGLDDKALQKELDDLEEAYRATVSETDPHNTLLFIEVNRQINVILDQMVSRGLMTEEEKASHWDKIKASIFADAGQNSNTEEDTNAEPFNEKGETLAEYKARLAEMDDGWLTKELHASVDGIIKNVIENGVAHSDEDWKGVGIILDQQVANGTLAEEDKAAHLAEIKRFADAQVRRFNGENDADPPNQDDLGPYRGALEKMDETELREELEGITDSAVQMIISGGDSEEYSEEIEAIVDQMVANGTITQEEKAEKLTQINNHIAEQVRRRTEGESNDEPDDDSDGPEDDDDPERAKEKEEEFISRLDPLDQTKLRNWLDSRREGEPTDPSFKHLKAEYHKQLRIEGGKISSKLMEAYLHRKGYTEEAIAEDKWWRTRVAKFEGWYDDANAAKQLLIDNVPLVERLGRTEEEWDEWNAGEEKMRPLEEMYTLAYHARWAGDKRAHRKYMNEAYRFLNKHYIMRAHELLEAGDEDGAKDVKSAIHAVALAKDRLKDPKLPRLPKDRVKQIDRLIKDGIKDYDEAKELESLKEYKQTIADSILASRRASDSYDQPGSLVQGNGATRRRFSGTRGQARERLRTNESGKPGRLRRIGGGLVDKVVERMTTPNTPEERYIRNYATWAADRIANDPSLRGLSNDEVEAQLRPEFNDYIQNLPNEKDIDPSLEEPS